MKIRYKADIAIAFVVFELSFWSIFLKIGGSQIGIIPQLFYGFLVGLIVSLSVALTLGKQKELVSIFKNQNALLLILFIGLLNNALTQIFLGLGTLGTNPSIGSIVYRSWIIMVALLTPIAIRQKVKKIQLLATFVGFLGIYIILSGGTLANFNLPAAPFIGLLLLAAASTTGAGLFMNKYTFDQFSTIVLFNLSSLVFITLIALATHTNLAVAFTPSSAISVLFLGIFAYGIGSSMVYYSYKVFGPLFVGNVLILVPFLTIIFSAFITNTQIQWYYIVAAMLISVGVVIQRIYSSKPERITSKSVLDTVRIFDVTSAFVSSKSPQIYSHIEGSNRAFAIRLDNTKFDKRLHNEIFNRRKCIVFTNEEPHEEAKRNEIEFINDIMGLKGGGTALIGLGNPQDLEEAFNEFVSNGKN